MNELKKIKFKIQWNNFLINKLHINVERLCKNCGKLKGSHYYKFGLKDCCYLDCNNLDQFNIREM